MPERPLDLPELSGLSVLVVEDNDDSLEIITTFLKVCGATVFGARNVEAALGYIATKRLDVLISDLHMPRRDGIDLIRTIRKTYSPAALPAIAITGYWEGYSDATAAGFDAFLRKPVDIDQLVKAILNVVSR
jgi:CheY-like chemotaxis protein